MRSALLCFLLLLGCRATPPATSPDPDAITGFIEVPGGKLYFEELGHGPALVPLHDGLLPSSTWDAQFADFARSFRVVRQDRRGADRSPVSPKRAGPTSTTSMPCSARARSSGRR